MSKIANLYWPCGCLVYVDAPTLKCVNKTHILKKWPSNIFLAWLVMILKPPLALKKIPKEPLNPISFGPLGIKF